MQWIRHILELSKARARVLNVHLFMYTCKWFCTLYSHHHVTHFAHHHHVWWSTAARRGNYYRLIIAMYHHQSFSWLTIRYYYLLSHYLHLPHTNPNRLTSQLYVPTQKVRLLLTMRYLSLLTSSIKGKS